MRRAPDSIRTNRLVYCYRIFLVFILHLVVSGHQSAWGGHVEGYPWQVGININRDGGTLLGSLSMDDFDGFFRYPNSEYPWQVGNSVSRDDDHEGWIDILSPTRNHDEDHAEWIDILSLIHARNGGYENWGDLVSTARSPDEEHTGWLDIHSVSHSSDDGDLDLFLVNAPGGNSFVHVIGVLTAVHVPEPSTFALVLLAALGIPFRTRIAQKRSGC